MLIEESDWNEPLDGRLVARLQRPEPGRSLEFQRLLAELVRSVSAEVEVEAC